MKKLFTVLAVLLIASVAFAAGFSGKAEASYTFDFDKKTIAYGKPGFGAMDVTFAWDTGDVVVGGESDTHIDFKASAEFKGWYGFGNNHAKGYQPWLKYDSDYDYYKTPEAGTYVISIDEKETAGKSKTIHALLILKVNTFKIVGKDWSVDFLGSVGLDFAKSAIDSAKFNAHTTEENVQAFSLDNSLKGKHNVAVTAFGGYKFGFGLGTEVKVANAATHKDDKKSDDWDKALTFAATAVTPEYDFNGVKFQAGAGYQVFNNVWGLAASAKASYAADKWSLGGAFDAALAKNAQDEAFVKNDLAINFAFAPVAVDVYFNNEGAQAKDKYYDYFSRTPDAKTSYEYKEASHKKTLASNYLSAKVVVDVAKVAENVPVTVTVTGKNLINADSQILNLEAETTVVPNFKFGAYFLDICDQSAQDDNTEDHRKVGATVEFTGLQNLTLNGEVAYKFAKLDSNKMFQMMVGASYAHELFTASASVAAEKFYDKDVEFAGKAAVVSTTLVEGAELSAKAYFNLNDLQILDEGSNATNKLALACKVSF